MLALPLRLGGAAVVGVGLVGGALSQGLAAWGDGVGTVANGGTVKIINRTAAGQLPVAQHAGRVLHVVIP